MGWTSDGWPHPTLNHLYISWMICIVGGMGTLPAVLQWCPLRSTSNTTSLLMGGRGGIRRLGDLRPSVGLCYGGSSCGPTLTSQASVE